MAQGDLEEIALENQGCSFQGFVIYQIVVVWRCVGLLWRCVGFVVKFGILFKSVMYYLSSSSFAWKIIKLHAPEITNIKIYNVNKTKIKAWAYQWDVLE